MAFKSPAEVKATNDFFAQIDALFRHQKPEGAVNTFSLHRFLASDPSFAPFAKELAMIWEDELVVEIWRTSLPRMNKAPRLYWTGPRKGAAASELIKKVADIEGYSLAEAEENLTFLQQVDPFGFELMYMLYGVEEKKRK